jgi:hypothetical protein
MGGEPETEMVPVVAAAVICPTVIVGAVALTSGVETPVIGCETTRPVTGVGIGVVIPGTPGVVIGTVRFGIGVVKPGTIAVVGVGADTPVKTNVPFEFNCVATGSEVKDGPTNANPITLIGTSELINSNPVKGCENSARPGKSSVTNLASCVLPPKLMVLVVTVIPRSLLRPIETAAVASFGLRIATPVSAPVFTSTLTTTFVSVTSGLGSTLDWKKFPFTRWPKVSETLNPWPPPFCGVTTTNPT